jgi:nucleotide-binding universal stress UspA family protein
MKNLLVVFENSDAALARLDTACVVARDFDAHLTVLAVTRPPSLIASAEPNGAGEIYVQELEDARARLADTAMRAREKLEAAGVADDVRVMSEFAGSVSPQVARHARYADLTLAGQPEEHASSVALDALEGALFDSGRPVVMVPSGWDGRDFGIRILLAWDGGREAARATRDALPLLMRAETVHVAVVAPEIGPGAHGEDPGADLATVLARNGVTVEVDVIGASRQRISQTLLGRAKAYGADLVVMGAYGHSRFRETLLGGVTREMIEESGLPLFLSH